MLLLPQLLWRLLLRTVFNTIISRSLRVTKTVQCPPKRRRRRTMTNLKISSFNKQSGSLRTFLYDFCDFAIVPKHLKWARKKKSELLPRWSLSKRMSSRKKGSVALIRAVASQMGRSTFITKLSSSTVSPGCVFTLHLLSAEIKRLSKRDSVLAFETLSHHTRKLQFWMCSISTSL